MIIVTIQAVLPGMRALKWGRRISLSSVAAQVGGVVGPHYAASKAGILGLTHYYAAYLAKEGITVNAIAPGPVSTEMAAGLQQLKPNLIPVGRFGTPERSPLELSCLFATVTLPARLLISTGADTLADCMTGKEFIFH